MYLVTALLLVAGLLLIARVPDRHGCWQEKQSRIAQGLVWTMSCCCRMWNGLSQDP
jgi:hypothetical protein